MPKSGKSDMSNRRTPTPPPAKTPKANNQTVLEQNWYWDILNNFEIYLVIACQKIFCVKQLYFFHTFFEFLLSSRLMAFYPLLLFSLGLKDESVKCGKEIVYYSLFSSFGKYLFLRKRPCHYPSVYSPDPAPTSSFPSRHSIAVFIISGFIPNETLRYIAVTMMVINRLVLGLHFLTDCLVGLIIGWCCVVLAKHTESVNLLLIITFVALEVWHNCARITAGLLPVLLAGDIKCTPFVFPFALIKFPLIKLTTKIIQPKTRYEVFAVEILPSAVATYLVSIASPYLEIILDKMAHYK